MTDWDAYIDRVAPVMDLTITPEQRPAVRQFLGIAAEMAATLDAVPLDDADLALAPVFRPATPEA